ncbi:39S ribosomal protein L34, mitochondrial [Diorhabda sublineata]|uniref:39S ribosomal protein L34, mitochondrial n=1 Tax=Diorhabda sublineata TaxID=1163346 RepID=UPI0024E0F064|nr:39S ribosomal protein L34, mitochondrial [Diorhabda sublineata]
MNIVGLTRYVPNILSRCTSSVWNSVAPFHFFNVSKAVDHRPGGLFGMITRSVIRVHFPRPSERKRIKVHGWNARMKTAAGRRVLMNRILKGRFVYSH